MNTVELIRKKRQGEVLNNEELAYLVNGFIEGVVPDYQMSAFLMACFFKGMNDEEAVRFTELMLRSGTVLDLSDIPGAKIDKHSTGGVADTVSLILAPIVASCGVKVPMISGRGLGHTGGTLDKLESIPGFRTDLGLKEFRQLLRQLGVSMIGQTREIAPADKKLYALRDVTATVESPSLIAGSIMSKKLASGIDALVLDIKTGNGAFMQEMDSAVDLARRLVGIGERAGKRTIAYITDMNQPLGPKIGNWLEIEETIRSLHGDEDELNRDLMTVTHLLAGTMLYLGKESDSVQAGIERSRRSVADGSAYEIFRSLVAGQGGDPASLEGPGPYPPPRHTMTVSAAREGFLGSIDTHSLGMCSVLLGAGRLTLSDTPDPVSGIVLHKRLGMKVLRGDPIATVITNDESRIGSVSERIQAACSIHPTPPDIPLLVRATVTADGAQLWEPGKSPVFPS